MTTDIKIETNKIKEEITQLKEEIANFRQDFNAPNYKSHEDINKMGLAEFIEEYEKGTILKEQEKSPIEPVKPLWEGIEQYKHLDRYATDEVILANAEQDFKEFKKLYEKGKQAYISEVRYYLERR